MASAGGYARCRVRLPFAIAALAVHVAALNRDFLRVQMANVVRRADSEDTRQLAAQSRLSLSLAGDGCGGLPNRRRCTSEANGEQLARWIHKNRSGGGPALRLVRELARLEGTRGPPLFELVEFPGHAGVRVAGRLRGCPPQEAAIGMAVEIGFEPGPGGFAIPSFVAVPATPGATP